MNINKIAFLSNTITKPLERFLSNFNISHYPLDTVIDQLYKKTENDLVIILLDIKFFGDEYEKNFQLLKNAILFFRQNNDSKLIINSVYDEFNEIFIPLKQEHELKLVLLNKKIISLMHEINNLAILDFYTLCKEYGAYNLISQKNRYLFQTPFTKMALKLLALKIQELIILFTTPRIKAIALDADNTLWGGIVAEDGIENIQIDNNYPGIIYKKFQEYCLQLKQSGIILILLSKNDEKAVQEVFNKKDMPLKIDDFVATAINWNCKSENLISVLQGLKLTKTGVIFLDDSEAEIAQMSQRVGIKCYKMNPNDPLLNIQVLKDIIKLKTLHLSHEDTKKTKLYQDEKERLTLNTLLQSKDDFVASLNIEITVTCNDLTHIQRITQLINKTNQFNLTTKRYNLTQIQQMMQDNLVYDFKVKDRFGDMGIIGVIIINKKCIDSFVMSCRVLGRNIECNILNIITHKYPYLSALYCKTDKNSLVEEFYEQNGFEIIKQDRYKYYKLKHVIPINKNIKVIDES